MLSWREDDELKASVGGVSGAAAHIWQSVFDSPEGSSVSPEWSTVSAFESELHVCAKVEKEGLRQAPETGTEAKG